MEEIAGGDTMSKMAMATMVPYQITLALDDDDWQGMTVTFIDATPWQVRTLHL